MQYTCMLCSKNAQIQNQINFQTVEGGFGELVMDLFWVHTGVGSTYALYFSLFILCLLIFAIQNHFIVQKVCKIFFLNNACYKNSSIGKNTAKIKWQKLKKKIWHFLRTSFLQNFQYANIYR